MDSDRGISTEVVVGGGGRVVEYQLPTQPPLPRFNFRTNQGPTVSVYNIKSIAFYGCSAITRIRNCTIFIEYATIFGQFTAAFHFF